jgi:hypothetical protein
MLKTYERALSTLLASGDADDNKLFAATKFNMAAAHQSPWLRR